MENVLLKDITILFVVMYFYLHLVITWRLPSCVKIQLQRKELTLISLSQEKICYQTLSSLHNYLEDWL